MQAQIRLVRTVVAVAIAVLVLGACSGGDGEGSTWFNLPSVPVAVDANGNASVLGFNLGYIGLQPALIGQLQQANVQELDIRIGYHGIFPYANGSPLPYIRWNDESVDLLQQVLRNAPDVPNGGQIASALPWLRRIGTGATLQLPLAAGATALNIPNWSGEELVTAESAGETTLGPFQFGGLAFDREGNASIAGVPLSELEQALGTSLGISLPPNVLAILNAINAQQLSVSTQPNGIDLSVDGRSLPGIAYDSARLANTLNIAQPLVGDPALAETLATVVPQLPGADIDLTVSLTGEPAGETQLASIPLTVNEDGSLSAFGIALPGASLPPDVVTTLQDANIQRLDLSVQNDSLYIAANQEPLPTISWTESSLETLGQVVPGLPAGSLPIVRNLLAETNVGLSLDLPTPAGAEELTFADDFDPTTAQFAAAEEATGRAAIQLGVVFDEQGALQSLGGVPASALDALGVSGITLPPQIGSILDQLGASQLRIATSGNDIELMADDQRLFAITYDQAALDRMLGLASNLVDDAQTIEEVGAVLPQILSSDINVAVSVGGEAPETRLTSLPISLGEDGTLSAYGFPLGAAPILQPEFIQELQTANVQRLDANIIDDSLYLATNGEVLPVISWTDQSLDVVQEVVGNLLGVSPDLLATVISFLQNSDVGLAIAVPTAQGTEPVVVASDFDPTSIQWTAPELGDERQPVLQLGLTLEGSQITSVSGIPAATWRALGVTLPSLPPNISTILYDGLQANELKLVAVPNGLDFVSDDQSLLTLSYDTASLERLLNLAKPFFPPDSATALRDPNVTDLLMQQIIPLVVGVDLNVTAALE